ncbi:MAG TPA: hypothetical protein ENN64_00175 [bacterium]|nr:hypothetical protein [bacterium]
MKILKWCKKFFIIFVLLLSFYISAVPSYILSYGKVRTYSEIEQVSTYKVGIVFGAGLTVNRRPSKILQDRLDTAADLLENERIEIIIVSGDNRFENYNEPQAMYDYLINDRDIDKSLIIRDFAGRRTYDTCKRASEIWNVNRALLISQGYHLYRAVFTCNQLGVKSAGFSATRRSYLGEFRMKRREYFAIHKSVYDLYINPPPYVGGEKEEDLSE